MCINMTDRKKTILLDLDGVINTYSSNYSPDYIPPLREGARGFVEKLSKKYNIKLFTTRNKMLASIWLIENNLNEFISGVTNTKELCWLFVDDRCVCFNGNYNELFQDIENFEAWHKK